MRHNKALHGIATTRDNVATASTARASSPVRDKWHHWQPHEPDRDQRWGSVTTSAGSAEEVRRNPTPVPASHFQGANPAPLTSAEAQDHAALEVADMQGLEVHDLLQNGGFMTDVLMNTTIDSVMDQTGTMAGHEGSLSLANLAHVASMEPGLEEHFPEPDWIDNFDFSTATYSSVFHTALPLWPSTAWSPESLIRPPESPKPVVEKLDKTLPTPGSRKKRDLGAHGSEAPLSLLDRVFSRRSSPEPGRPSAPSGPTALQQPSTQVTSVVRSRLVHRLEHFSHLLPGGFVLPSHHALSRYTTSYFDVGAPHQPFIHVPTWRPETCSFGLFFAVCAMGARYCFEHETSLQLWHVGKAILTAEIDRGAAVAVRAGDDDSGLGAAEYTSELMEHCQGLVLLMMYATWAGDKYLLRQALSFQSGLAAVSGPGFGGMGGETPWRRFCC